MRTGNSFNYTIPSRETWYDGNKYRSELEASWAAFFDKRGITVSEYEPATPFDHIWRPDFSISLVDGGFTFAEVKPFASESQ